VASASLRPVLRRTTTYSIDLNNTIRRGPKSLEERPTSGFLRKLAFSAPAAVPDLLYRLRLPGPGFVRWCPALPGCSGHGVLAPENPSDATAVRERRLPGGPSPPGPTPLNRLFSGSLRPGRATLICILRADKHIGFLPGGGYTGKEDGVKEDGVSP